MFTYDCVTFVLNLVGGFCGGGTCCFGLWLFLRFVLLHFVVLVGFGEFVVALW